MFTIRSSTGQLVHECGLDCARCDHVYGLRFALELEVDDVLRRNPKVGSGAVYVLRLDGGSRVSVSARDLLSQARFRAAILSATGLVSRKLSRDRWEGAAVCIARAAAPFDEDEDERRLLIDALRSCCGDRELPSRYDAEAGAAFADDGHAWVRMIDIIKHIASEHGMVVSAKQLAAKMRRIGWVPVKLRIGSAHRVGRSMWYWRAAVLSEIGAIAGTPRDVHLPQYRKRGSSATSTFISFSGYRWVDGKAEHRAVVEAAMGRALVPGEEVHHVNGDKLDNRAENLIVMSKSEHARLHCDEARRLANPMEKDDT